MKLSLGPKCATLLMSVSTAICACSDNATTLLRQVDGGDDTAAEETGRKGDATLNYSSMSDAGLEARVGVSDVAPDADDSAQRDATAAETSDDGAAGEDAPFDTDAPFDVEPGPTTDSILGSLGPDCLNCATTSQCLSAAIRCEFLAGHVADAGPAVGETREQLCLDTLSCIVATKCAANAQSAVTPCYCGNCTPTAQGACRTAEERGLETTVAFVALSSFTSLTLGAGMANAIVGCLLESCSCFPANAPSDAGADGTAAIDGGDRSSAPAAEGGEADTSTD